MIRGKYIRTEKHREDSRKRASGNTFMKGKHHSKETKIKMKESALKVDHSLRIGEKRTAETKENIRKSLKGKYIGEKNPFYGKKHSEETKKKIRDTIASHGSRFGENSFVWKGGASLLKGKAIKRDDYTCQKCGLRDKEIIIVDHIKPKSIYPELKDLLENLQCLCPNCHARKTTNELKDIIRIKKLKICQLHL
jgi:hypothetical protein